MRHEIGAHTLTHPDLTRLSRAAKKDEIEGGKKWLEDVIGDPVLAQKVGMSEPIVLGPWAVRILTMSVILVLGLVNVRGVRWGGGLQLAITLVKVGSLNHRDLVEMAVGKRLPGRLRQESAVHECVQGAGLEADHFGVRNRAQAGR